MRNFLRASMIGIILGLVSSSSSAAILEWDPDLTPPPSGGAGTWNTSALQWFDGANDIAWINANNDVAQFGGTGGAVTLGVPITANGLTFNVNGYSVASSTLTLAGATPTISVTNASDSVTISSTIAGTVGFTKAGAGRLILNTANTFTGNITLDAGVLQTNMAGGAATSPLGNQIGTTYRQMIFNGGTLNTTANWNDNAPSATNVGIVFNFTGAGTLNVNSGTTLTIDDGSGAGTGSTNSQLQGSGTLTKEGTGTISLGNGSSNFSAFTGAVIINAGQITVNGGTNQLGTSAAGTTVNSGAALNLITSAGSEPITINGTGISSGGALFSASGTGSTSGAITLAGNSSIGGAGTLNLSGAVSDGVNSFSLTKVGAGTTTLSNAANAYDGTTTVSAGILNFDVAGALPSTTVVTINANSGAAFGFSINQTLLNDQIADGSNGSVLLGVDSANALDFSAGMGGANLGATSRLGARAGSTVNYSGTHTPATAGTYRFGGPGTLNLSLANGITGGSSNVDIGTGGLAAGTVQISADNDYGGTTTVTGATLSIASVNDSGNNSPIGNGASALSLVGGTLTFTGGTDSTNRGISLGTGGGTVNVNTGAATLTVASITGGNALTIGGAGTLESTAAITVGALTLNGGSLSLPLGGTASGALTNNNSTATVNIPTGQTLTVNNAINIGANANASVTLTGGGAFVMNAITQTLTLANNTSDGGNETGTLNASALTSFTADTLNIRIGQGTSGNDGIPVGILTLPSASGTTSTLTTTAAGSIIVGGPSGNGGSAPAATLTLGGGSNTVTTPTLQLGNQKTGSLLQFGAASGGSLNLTHPSGGTNKVSFDVARNVLNDTSTNPISVANFTTTGNVNMTLGNLTLGIFDQDVDTNGGANGTFTLNASGGLVTADAVRVGQVVARAGSETNNGTATGTFNLAGGTFQFNTAGSGFIAGPNVGGSGAGHNRTMNINVSGGTLNLQGAPITLASTGTGTTNLDLIGTGLINMGGGNIGNLTTIDFTGGTLRNLGTLNRALTQSAATPSLLDVLDNNTVINGVYTQNGGTATIAATRSLTATSLLIGGLLQGNGTAIGDVSGTGIIAPGASTGTLNVTGNVDFDGSFGMEVGNAADNDLLAISGNLTLDALTDLLDLTQLPATSLSGTYTLVTFGGSLVGAFDTVEYNNVVVANPLLPFSIGGTHELVYNANNIQLIQSVPEPTTFVLGALGLVGLVVARRRMRRA